MAIGTTPLFSKISGSAGPVDYRTRRNGKIEIGKKRIPANPQSAEQQNTRNAYGRLHELWQNAAWIDKTQYENIAAAYDISPWNAFLMRHLPIMRLNPVAYWPFVEGTGNTLHDFTVNENHGTIYGAVWELHDKYSIPNLFFDGIDDRVICPNHSSLNFLNTLSINAVINSPNTTKHYQGIIKKGLPNKGYHFMFGGTTGRLYPYAKLGAVWQIMSRSSVLTNNTTYNLLFRYNGTQSLMYRNDTPETPISQSGNVNGEETENLYIGEGAYGSFNYSGLIKQIYMLDYTLTPAQIIHQHNISTKFYKT